MSAHEGMVRPADVALLGAARLLHTQIHQFFEVATQRMSAVQGQDVYVICEETTQQLSAAVTLLEATGALLLELELSNG
ncbi:MAG TPA: hypothetical protein VIX86_05520 [Streptosporangiaceae bacterium]